DDWLTVLQQTKKNVDNIVRRSLGWGWPGRVVFRPFCDIGETEDEIIVQCEMPGMEKDKVQVEVANDTLHIQGSTCTERSKEKERGSVQWRMSERSCGTFSRAFSLPRGVDPKSVRARYENGLLNVKIPKPEGVRGE